LHDSLGRRLCYTYELETLVAGELLVMATSEGSLPMKTTYTWADAPDGSRANQRDLVQLRQILEYEPAPLDQSR